MQTIKILLGGMKMQRRKKMFVRLFIIFLMISSILFFPGKLIADQIPFRYQVIDENAIALRAVGDVDLDGKNDIIAAFGTEAGGSIFQGTLAWYEYPNWIKYPIGDPSDLYYVADLIVADLDGDKDPDLIIPDTKSGEYVRVYFYENPLPNGNPKKKTWMRHLLLDSSENLMIKDLEIEDMNLDGRKDIVLRLQQEVMILMQNTPISFTNKFIGGLHKKEGMDTGDIDGDGDPDIVCNGYWLENPGDVMNGEWKEHNIDSKWYTQNTGVWMDNNCRVLVDDINKDGSLDVVLSHSENKGFPVSWYESSNLKNGQWTEHVIGQVDYCHTLQSGDMDNDGDIDIVSAELPRWSAPYPVIIFRNNGKGISWTEQRISNNTGSYIGVIGDLGSDCDLDIVGGRSYNKAPVEIWENLISDPKLVLDRWTYIGVDSTRKCWGDWNEPNWLRSFGLAMRDITGDDFKDIVAGRYFYRNPGDEMTGKWQRVDFNINVDAMLFVDVDNDEYGDVIAEALPDVYWLEAKDRLGNFWEAVKIANLPATGHINGQGYMLGQIIPGGKPEIILAVGDGIHYLEIPEKPLGRPLPSIRIAAETMDEGIGVGDMDDDGDIDIVAGIEREPKKSYSLIWFENPGDGSGDWKGHLISTNVIVPDRIVTADFNGDALMDVAVSEERYPGEEPDASLYWFERPSDPKQGGWTKHHIITEYSLNNLDAADLDNDGDIDIVTNEHKGEKHKLQIFENDSMGNFTEHLIGSGTEMHLGARLADLDNDGDLDIVGVPWDEYQLLHVWRNDASRNPKAVKWTHISSQYNQNQLPMANVGRQASAVVFDIDKDGADDIVVAGWSDPSMVWLRRTENGWDRYLVDNRKSHIEAGGDYYDIDGDGDLDILQGGSWAVNEVWWWENPYPKFDLDKPWSRYTIKDWGSKQHHDQIFGDFDGDGKTELVFWNQQAQKLMIADIPKNPRKNKGWEFTEIWSWPKAFKYEGLAKADVDLDGKIDLIGGGYWFKHEGCTKFTPNIIDDYGKSRSAAGDLIKGGRPEIVLCSGDGIGPLNLYQWENNIWIKYTLIDTVVHGHTLQVVDLNGDGNLDIYTAEMYRPGAGPECKQWVLYSDGKGNFTKQIVSIGIGTHEGKIGDLDGDGDLDILQKDFQEHRRLDVWLNEQ